jgi:hypothetical protein
VLADKEITLPSGKGGAGIMTEEQAHIHARALADGMGITFYVVRSREGRFLPVQRPSDDCEILETVTPPIREEFDSEGIG